MDRRAFITIVGGGSLAVPLVANAQPARKVWQIGLISGVYRKDEDAFFQRLRDLGYVEGQNLIVERLYSEGKAKRFQEFASELVRHKADVIVVTTTPAALAARSVTKTIPIVHPVIIDPVGAGLVASLARPGGNITGATTQAPDLVAKRLQLLKEAIPHLSRVVVLWNAANPANAGSWKEVQDAAHVLGVTLQSREVRGPEDFERVFAAIALERPDALLFIGDVLTLQYAEQIVKFVKQHRIPSMFDRGSLAMVGGLMSYGPDQAELWRHAAVLIDKIFKGANPAELPIEQPTKFELVINLKTAKALGLTVPPSLLARADQVIE